MYEFGGRVQEPEKSIGRQSRGCEQIAPVGNISPSGGLSTPDDLPRTVQSWNLREPDNSKCANLLSYCTM